MKKEDCICCLKTKGTVDILRPWNDDIDERICRECCEAFDKSGAVFLQSFIQKPPGVYLWLE